MSKPKVRRSSAPPKRAATPSAAAARMDGVAHWRKTLDRLIWMLLRAGIDPGDIILTTARTLRARRRTGSLVMPAYEVLEYVRVATFWRNEPEYLDASGRPRRLPALGKSPSFKSLVHLALPQADSAHVLRVLRDHRLVSVDREERVTLRGHALVPRTAERAQFVAYSLGAIEGLIDTCYTNLNARNPSRSLGLLQRTAVAEQFDLSYLPQYDAFMRKQAEAFLLKQDAWLKRHEVKGSAAHGAPGGHVGVGVYGFKAR